MNLNLNNYEINTADIWLYERGRFFSDKKDVSFMRELLNKLQYLLTDYGPRDYGKEQYDEAIDNANFRNKFEERFQNYQKVVMSTLEDKVQLGYFFSDNSYFCDYSHPIVVIHGHQDYKYWFALKLKQYDSDISLVSEFLTYQLINNFKNDFSKLKSLLEFLNVQYDYFINPKIAFAINNWSNSHKPKHSFKELPERTSKEFNPIEKDMQSRFEDMEIKLIENNKYLIRGDDEQLTWKGYKKTLAIFIMWLYDNGFFFKRDFDKNRKKIKRYFEERYEIELKTNFEESRIKGYKDSLEYRCYKNM